MALVSDGCDMNSGHCRLTTVLVVDDDVHTRGAFESILTSAGHFVIGAPNGAAAIESMRIVTPDAVITDVNMPELDGIRLCRIIRSSRGLRHVPVIVASSQVPDELTASELFDVCLRKPIDPERLIYAVSTLVFAQTPRPSLIRYADDDALGIQSENQF
jgi:CheY-like chemotaxis protein